MPLVLACLRGEIEKEVVPTLARDAGLFNDPWWRGSPNAWCRRLWSPNGRCRQPIKAQSLHTPLVGLIADRLIVRSGGAKRRDSDCISINFTGTFRPYRYHDAAATYLFSNCDRSIMSRFHCTGPPANRRGSRDENPIVWFRTCHIALAILTVDLKRRHHRSVLTVSTDDRILPV